MEEMYKGYKIIIKQDENPDNPRDEPHNFGHMVCYHRRYALGDTAFRNENHPDPLKFKDWIVRTPGVYAFPLFLMDHSGLSISATSDMFRAVDQQAWDWGLIGFIYATKEEAKKEFGSHYHKEQILHALLTEVRQYDRYLRGEVLTCEVEDLDEMVGGFYSREDALTYAYDVIDSYLRAMGLNEREVEYDNP